MKPIHQTYTIGASAEKVWDALTNPATIEKWGGGPSTMDLRSEGKFTFWGGDIHGFNTKIVPHRLLEQDWFGGNWDNPSRVTFTLTEKNDYTTVDLLQSGVPEAEREAFDRGWKEHFLGPMKEFLEKTVTLTSPS
jgi:uncharacterized protein YndB with AHSA1/START domain